MRTLVGIVVSLGLVAGCGADADSVKQQCEQGLEIVAAVSVPNRVSSRVPSKRLELERQKHARRAVEGLKSTFMAECTRASQEYRDCILEAGERSDVVACRNGQLN